MSLIDKILTDNVVTNIWKTDNVRAVYGEGHNF